MPFDNDDELLEVKNWTVGSHAAGMRLDHFLRDQDLGITRSQLKKIIDSGLSTVANEVSKPARKLRLGQDVVFGIPRPQPLSIEAQDIPLDIHYEDEYLVVINKPQGLVVHPAPGHPNGTLVNAVLFACSAAGGDPLRPGIVHRLDKDTSGLMLVAKREDAHACLAGQFHEHSVDRRYKVLVAGSPPDKGQWDTLHGRHPGDRRRFSSKVTRGKRAVSHFFTVERFKEAAMMQVKLFTGRTHQVRVHCHDHGFSVLGDPWYGPRHLSESLRDIHKMLPGQALHAELLGFDHPATGKRLRFEVGPPTVFVEALTRLRS